MSVLDTLRRPAAVPMPPSFTAALEQVREAFAALDFTEQNGEIAELDASVAKITAAIDEARQRIAELGETDSSGADGRAVANALLDGQDPDVAAQAATAAGERAERKAALVAALPALVEQRTDAINRKGNIVDDAKRSVARAGQPLVDAIAADAREAAERLSSCFADLAALHMATKAGQREHDALTGIVREIASSRLLESTRDYPVSNAVQGLGKTLSGKGAAFPMKYPLAASVEPPATSYYLNR